MQVRERKEHDLEHPLKIRFNAAMEVNSAKQSKAMVDRNFHFFIKEKTVFTPTPGSKNSKPQTIFKPVLDCQDLSSFNASESHHKFPTVQLLSSLFQQD
jgi:hypothetical protein